MQQDAHEFLNYLLNTISETLSEEKRSEKASKTNGVAKKGSSVINPSSTHDPRSQCQPSGSKGESTWIHEIFQGTLTNETRCLNCETV
uniref:ubiquitinyl hydrolase 1 n=1 Tax=Parascaris univalens TaxID=6257 RepID=A0A915A5V6_PARUN